MLNGKVVVISGGAGLLGRSLMGAVRANGGIPICAEKDLSHARKNLGPEYSLQEMDITNEESVRALVHRVVADHGKVDALVNCAFPRNSQYGTSFWELKYEDFCENIGTHLGGYFVCSKVFAEQFKKQGYGNIVSVSSIYGVVAPRFEIYEGTTMTNPVEYGVIKSGLQHMTKYMAMCFKGLNIRANCVSPGGILNKQDPKFLQKYQEHCLNKGMLDVNDLHGTFLFLLSDASQYINGQNLVVDDGFTL